MVRLEENNEPLPPVLKSKIVTKICNKAEWTFSKKIAFEYDRNINENLFGKIIGSNIFFSAWLLVLNDWLV